MLRRSSIVLIVLVGGSGAGCSSNTETTPSGLGGEGGAGGTVGDASADGPAQGGGGAGGFITIDASTGCKGSSDCDGGVCMPGGRCCESADRVCGSVCCGGTQACLFGVCVDPGASCITASDCPGGQYCEPALGEPGIPDAGADASVLDGSAEGGPVCTQAIPPKGRCVPAPVPCDSSGKPDGCVEPCEYRPPVGELRASMKWDWGTITEPEQYPSRRDVWSTPVVARVVDANCDGRVDSADPPNMIFVSGNAKATCCSCSGDAVSTCQTGVVRMLDGRSGREVWSIEKATSTSVGFAGMSVAVGDVDGDKKLDVVAMTGEGRVALLGDDGAVKAVASDAVDGWQTGTFGWGGGLSIGDMDGDGLAEIAYGRTLLGVTATGEVTRLWVGKGGSGSSLGQALSHFVDLDLDGKLELLAGRTAYRKDGTTLWDNAEADGFTAVGDFDDDDAPDVVVVHAGTIRLLRGLDGSTLVVPLKLPGSGNGGPPTIADFDGDGMPEVGVAQADLYTMLEVDMAEKLFKVVWSQANHDMSSSVTGSSVFDFQGDGKAEVVYNDECYLWVYDGATGDVLFTTFTQSFTATESSIVADVDGDGHAELVRVANGADPSRWTCAHHNAPGVIASGHTKAFPVWQPAGEGKNYRGVSVFGDVENAWVGTRTLWNQHVYNVTNVCDPRDSACESGAYYGQLPAHEKRNWQQAWLNNFRQNVQDKGVFDAPDVVVSVEVRCETPLPMTVSVRNLGLAGLPKGVVVGLFEEGTPETKIGEVVTTRGLLPGQTEVIEHKATGVSQAATVFARVLVDDANPTFRECRPNNNESAHVQASCVP